MSTADADALSERISHALAEAIKAGEIPGGGMPDKFVLVGTSIDEDGGHRMIFSANNGARSMETLGLLDGGQAVWRSEFVDWVRGTED
ncbi:hypothetical protein OG884_18695 [Streptosporangium sp. NBC_01755]|uniref:hypothetical protein n=1 Tax=unclassified Streptosporangium TaxID=2632669 RepID=UPI002DDBA52C|nr:MULTISPECIES: hypothetical protein [unclassified Streptosporangium]WSA23703.1 hypothetical protein OIE13_22440 [Streptosporangium sp. NBC_01810]WSD03837.1 hypothetical protein OG884_18695 [Streptosporangium sp. NBC_01755]